MASIFSRLLPGMGSTVETPKVAKDTGALRLSPLFHDIKFAVILSDDFDDLKANQITALLISHGAEHKLTVDCAKSFSITEITHIITTTADFAMFDSATDSLKSILKPNWVHDCLKRNKLVPQKPYNPDPRLIFSDVIVLCVDLPEGDQDAIMAGVVAMGGQYVAGLNRSVTHVVALSEHNDICQTALQSKESKALIVLPHWFDDCLKLRRRLSEQPYLLPDPEILRGVPLKAIPTPNTSRVNGATRAHEEDAPPSTSEDGLKASRSVFQDRSFVLDRDLGLSSERKKTIKQIITSGGGTLESTAKKADILICRYREGTEFRRFADEGKIVGTMSWLYYLITYNRWVVPTQRLLHFPVAKNGVPGFSEYKIAASGYSGPARVYIESLVKAAGATFTKAMRQDNTHLIAAQASSEKGRAAEDWNIHKVNHLWLEESYAKWEAQSVSNSRYSHFPPRTNLTEIVGSTPIDLEVVKADFSEQTRQLTLPTRGGSQPGSPMKNSSQKPRIKDSELSQVTPTKSSFKKAVSAKLDAFKAIEEQGDVAMTENQTASDQAEVLMKSIEAPAQDNMDNMEVDEESPAKKRKTDRRSLPPVGIEMQDVTPVRASRAAKTKATHLLHDTIAPDIAMYEKEKKRKSGNIWGGVRGAGAGVVESPVKTPLKRTIDKASPETESGAESVERDGKRVKSNKTSPQAECAIRLVVTNYDPWGVSTKRKAADERKLKDMGIELTEVVAECTHMAAPKIVRTPKFVAGIAAAPCIVSSAWLDRCLKENKPCDTSEFLLEDAAGESKYNMTLSKTLARAKKNGAKLLDECTIFCAPNVSGGFETVNAVISANGGTCIQFKATTRVHETDTTTIGKSRQLVLLSTEQDGDKKLWPAFERMANQTGQPFRIVLNEWLLTVAMQQEQTWNPAWLLSGK